MKKELLQYCYKHQKQYVYEESQREFDCLIALVEEGRVSSYEELAEYGMEY
jgi:hypothetical protein